MKGIFVKNINNQMFKEIFQFNICISRIMEPEFILGTNRKKLDEKLGGKLHTV